MRGRTMGGARRAGTRAAVGRLAVAVLAAATVLAGCTGGETSADDQVAPVIAPGRPGEPAATLSSAQLADAARTQPPNDADFRYVRRMIPHHQQALQMSALVPERAASDQVRGLAERITASQGPEVKALASWLERHTPQTTATAPPEGHTGHGQHQTPTAPTGASGHAGAPEADVADMPGMATPEQLAALQAARGPDFDRLFLQLMTAHHQGAVSMANEVLTAGSDVLVEEMAQDVVAVQSDEIQRMRALLGQ